MPARFTLIVCERNNDWVVPLRLALADAAPRSAMTANDRFSSPLVAGVNYRLVETRNSDDCLAALAEEPLAVVALQLSPSNCDQALSLLRTIAERYPAARTVVLAAREAVEYQWLARELGATGFVSSPRQLQEFLLIARRHWQSLPQPELGAAESAWATLPWK
ncbi:MAG TPA: hypothetical protein VGN12_10105 [Pirellulales bacterium]|jgi:DNA-binding NtrC family response regulator